MSTGLIVIFSVIALVIIVIVGMYNQLVVRKNAIDYANGAVDSMYKLRFDLIPNLVKIVKQYMQYESSLLERLTELRAQTTSDIDLSAKERSTVDRQLEQAINTYTVAVENYPDLKASEQFSQLQASLNECEAQLAAARRTYNAAVVDYNNAIEVFPTNMMAGMMKYKRKEVITIPQQERDIPA